MKRTDKLRRGCRRYNATRLQVANSLQFVLAYVDLETRQVIPFGDDVASSIDVKIKGDLGPRLDGVNQP